MRTVNFRAFFIVSAAVTGAVLCAYLYMCFQTAGIIVGAAYLTAVFAASAVFIFKSVKKTIKLRVGMAFGLAFLLAVCAFMFAVFYINSRAVSAKVDGYRSISGRVCAVDVRGGIYRIDLDDVKADGKSADGVIRVTVRSSGDNNIAEIVSCGDKLYFDAEISCVGLIENCVVNGTSCRTDIRYNATVNSDEITVKFGKPKPIESFLSALREYLTENMGDKYGNIAFSMITGDKHALDYDISDYYSAAGLAHVMAVSGLHIGFMVVLFNLIMFRVGKKVKFGVIAAMLIAYVVIADFSPSVVRAAVMCLVSMFAVFVGGRRDILSAMLCAYSFILAFKPMYLFETGFVLSFGAIYGIALFSRSISCFLEKRGLHRKASEAVSSSAAVEIGIVPSIAYFYGEVQILALIVNAVLIPYISVVFVSIAVFAVVGAIPGLSGALIVPKYLLMPVDYIAQGIAAVPYSSFNINTTAAAFLCYPVMFFASGYFMMPKKGKIAVVIASVSACAIFVCIGTGKARGVYYSSAYEVNTAVRCADYNDVSAKNLVIEKSALRL